MNTAVSEVVENPFRSAPVVAAPDVETMAAAVSAREVAEVQASMIMARRFPRNVLEAVDNILQACTRPSLAEGALYEYERGGTDIREPSIHLARAIAQYWGHIDFGWRVVDEQPGQSTIQTFAWDMQTGTRSHRTFNVLHQMKARNTIKMLTDPQDIYLHVANMAARRLRACILDVIPKDVVSAAAAQCEHTLHTKIQVTPELLTKLVAQFAEHGVTRAHLEKKVQRRLEALTPGLVVQLGKIYTSLKDGMSTPATWFDMTPTDAPQARQDEPGGAGRSGVAPSPRQAVRDKLQSRRQARQGSSGEPPVTPETETFSPPPPDEPETTTPSPALQDVIRFCRAAQSHDDIARIRHICLQLTDEEEVRVAQAHLDAAIGQIGG